MGRYRIEIEAVGGRGCQRDVGDGEVVTGCGQALCPDCAARRFVMELRHIGQSIEEATLIHWPNEPSEVVDDLVTGERHGSFTP